MKNKKFNIQNRGGQITLSKTGFNDHLGKPQLVFFSCYDYSHGEWELVEFYNKNEIKLMNSKFGNLYVFYFFIFTCGWDR
ncbi:hypothetical protein HNQ88_004950 [Aureibacter tunicatorum]|uniref:Uncharacterized protein n=1 Tax=Aureibacter tunicatorum TaxID=866807 RepID=A0AAE3XSD1_9BACT|nr:hypothetical protein [Aureibacter tunicatorum]BDD07110.1 hypothetical protein AUTU_45930 [Aureibacter tunicatorum]